MLDQEIKNNVANALREDLGSGDLTAQLLPADGQAVAEIICREQAVICGQAWVNECFAMVDPVIHLDWHIQEGQQVDANSSVCRINGSARNMLIAERTALNFLQTLSAVATATQHYVNAVAGTGVRILDTRKTIPGLRLAEKYAVRCGGGHNHRIGLFDAILIKENHIRAAGSIAKALGLANSSTDGSVKIEIEVESLDELQQALAAGARYILLDNFSNDQLREAVQINSGRANLEASGDVSLDTVRDIALTGIDEISIGGLTKHIRATDFSMLFDISQ
ncbi:MAG: carboxylating nicotinate-nucleotide diphosphorylase [Gammaproteobacteria bacterium]|nr:carboxylating nicotinate-nucleotide diphosphorylase [Gammaproteobacteria bacterium]